MTLFAVQMQLSWAYTTNSVLLSAGYNNPLHGHGGSGIYQGHYGALEYSQPELSETFALVSLVPSNPNAPLNSQTTKDVKKPETNPVVLKLEKVFAQPSLLMEVSLDVMEEKIWNRHSPSRKDPSKYHFLSRKSSLELYRENVEKYTTKLVDVNLNSPNDTSNYLHNFTVTTRINETICTSRNKYCCMFDFEMKSLYVLKSMKPENIVSGDNFTNYYYRLAVFDGDRNITDGDTSVQGYAQICGIIPCLNKTVNSCALRTDNRDEVPPTVAPPATVVRSGETYVQVGTTFKTVNIMAEIKYADSITYPLILEKAKTPEEFGSAPDTSSFWVTTQYSNVTKSKTVSLQTKKELKNIGSIAIFTRVYKSTASIFDLTKLLLILPLVQIYHNLI